MVRFGKTNGGRQGLALALAAGSALLAWVPGLGLLCALAALILGARRWALAFGLLGLILGGAFTFLFFLLPRGGESPEEAQIRTTFEELFAAPPQAAAGGGAGPGAPAP